jgi:hypothetical protein
MDVSAKTCWEYLECPKEVREDCEVYRLDFCSECWMIRDIKTSSCPGVAELKITKCLDCPFFKSMNDEG